MRLRVTISSAIIWGSGQLQNNQRIKALVLFLLQIVFVSIELFTGTLNIINGSVSAEFRNAGFFSKGIWGLITLGDIPRASNKVKIYDHSVILLIGGLIALFTLIIFVAIYVYNIRDAYITRIKIEEGEKVSTLKYIKEAWNTYFEYIVISPSVILIVFLSLIPIMFSFLSVFTNYNANNIPPKNLVSWTGFKTFSDILTMPVWSGTFFKILTWNVAWAFIASLTTYSLGLIQAILINTKYVKLKPIWRGIYILPWAIPSLVSLLVFKTMFNANGPINRLLIDFGIIKEAIQFFSTTGWARLTIIIVHLWLGFPYFMALISGVLTTVSEELYEAASLDGANSYHKFMNITMPVVLQATAPLLILNIAGNFNNFGAVYFLTKGLPTNPSYHLAGSTDLLISWIYKLTYDNRMYNYAAAMSIFIFVIIATISTFSLLRTRSFKED